MREISKRFTKPKTAFKEIKHGLRAGRTGFDVVINILKDMNSSGDPLSYIKRLRHEINYMIRLVPDLSVIDAPILLFQGKHELESQPHRVISGEVQKKIDDKIQQQQRDYWNKVEQHNEFGSGLIDTWKDPIEEQLQEFLFPNSPFIRRILVDKWGQHSFPIVRAEQVATATKYLLHRYQRSFEKRK